MRDRHPRKALRFLKWFCPAHLYEEIEGDLIQKFYNDTRKAGLERANRKLWLNAIRFFRPGIVLRNRISTSPIGLSMILNNLRFSIRHLLHDTLNSTLHITGLALGMSVCLLIGLFIHYETSFDNFHNRADRIYRVNSVFKEGGTTFDLYATPLPLADALRREFTGVEQAAFCRAQFSTLVEINPQKIFKQEHVLIAEPEFLDIFKIDVIAGNAALALRTPYQALLTVQLATKYFGNEDAIGKTFRYKNKYTITVGGIIKAPPHHTSLPVAMLLSYVNEPEFLDNGDTWYFGDFSWTKLSTSTFVVLGEGHSPEDLRQHLTQISNKNINKNPALDKSIQASFDIQPLREIHFDTQKFGGGPWVRAINKFWLFVFAAIGMIVLVLACINFLNLSTAQAVARGKEVGVRKAIGAQRRQLIVQFLGEAFLLVLTAGIFAWGIAAAALQPVNTLLETNITFDPVTNPTFLLYLTAGFLLTVFCAGLYPAWLISRFTPASTLKANSGVKANTGSSWLRHTLVGVQFTVSAVLIIVVLLIDQQITFMREQELGFEQDRIINLEVAQVDKGQPLRQRLSTIAGVKDVSLSRSSPVSNDHWWNSMGCNETSERKTVCAIYGDANFLSFFGLRLLSGAPSDPAAYVPDSLRDDRYVSKVIVNEKLLEALALGSPETAVGKHFWWGGDAEIIGVVADFNTEPLNFGIPPTLIIDDPTVYGQVNVKLEKHSTMQGTIASIGQVWKNIFPEGVFEVKFLDQEIGSLYKLEEKLYSLFRIFAALTIAISCLGLWGLVTFSANRRTKEIGIRKVLGASVNAIVLLLSGDFLKVTMVAFAFASVVAYFVVNEMLTNFAYRITIGWEVFVIAGVILFTLIILTAGFKILRTASTSPVKSIKSE